MWWFSLVLAIGALYVASFAAQVHPVEQIGLVRGNGAPPPSWTPGAVTVSPDNIEVLPVQGQVYLVAGGGGNIVVQAGNDGLLVVDTGATKASELVLALLREHFDGPIRHIINTSTDADHVGGNALLSGSGVSQNARARRGAELGRGVRLGSSAQIYAHEAVLNRLAAPTGQQPLMPFAFWPTDTYFTSEKQLFFNGEAVKILYQPAAHTDGDSIVFFRRSDVVVTGDIYSTQSYPVFDPTRGGSYQGLITALNQVLEITIPDFHAEGGTYVVPGHGHISDEVDVAEYRNMATIIRDRVQNLINKGMTLDQVKAARPTLDYDGRFMETAGEWTADRFLEAVYQDLVDAAR
jgi:glyoxylase-like metal-dependent hydrolase (beta-lactamase superfamily II)